MSRYPIMPKDSIKTNSNIENQSEDKQKPTEKGKIKLLDVVALTEDVPEHNFKRGDICQVVEILSNGKRMKLNSAVAMGKCPRGSVFLHLNLE